MTLEEQEENQINKDLGNLSLYPFPISRQYPIKNQSLITYLILTEFDINSGSTVKYQYPEAIPDYSNDFFAEMMLPEGSHNRDTDYGYFFLNRQYPNLLSEGILSDKVHSDKYFLYGMNIIKTKHDSNVKRGAIVKAVAIFSPYNFLDCFKQPLEIVLESYFENLSEQTFIDFYHHINSLFDINTILPIPSELEKKMMRRGITLQPSGDIINAHIPDNWNYELMLNYNNNQGLILKYPISIPLYKSLNEYGNVSISNLIKIFGDSTMRIYHGILTSRRIMFVGYGHAACDIAQLVLSCVSMISPPLENTILRAFPYCNFSDLSFLDIPGYIAGSTNPMFQSKESWWDLICILDLPNQTGSVYGVGEKRLLDDHLNSSSNHLKSNSSSSSKSTQQLMLEDNSHLRNDQNFIIGVQSLINNNFGEYYIKQEFYDYTCQIFYLANDTKGLIASSRLSENIKKLHNRNIVRSSILKESKEFQLSRKHFWKHLNSPSTVEDLVNYDQGSSISTVMVPIGDVLLECVRKLQCQVNLNDKEVSAIYATFIKYLNSERDLRALVVLFPESTGGLTLLVQGIFHHNIVIKLNCLHLLQRLSRYESTSPAIRIGLNPFIVITYDRLIEQFRQGILQRELDLYLENENNKQDISEVKDQKSIMESLLQPTITAIINTVVSSDIYDADIDGNTDNTLDLSNRIELIN